MMTLICEIFDPIGSILLAPSQSDRPPLSAEKIGLSLSHLVSEILGPKVGLIFHHVLFMYYLSVMKHFVSILSLIFYPIDPLFHYF